MTIFILLGLGLLFLLVTGIIILFDNRRRKYKKKMLPLRWRAVGIVSAILAFSCLCLFGKYCVHFDGQECGDRKILLRTTMELSEVTIPTEDATLEPSLTECYKKVIDAIEQGDDTTRLKYVDALLNKKEIPLEDIHEVKYSEDLTKKQVQIVEYLVNAKEEGFTRPCVFYYIIFSEELLSSK